MPQPHPLLTTRESAHRGVGHLGLVISGKAQVYQAVVVVQHFGVPLNRRLPIFINAALELEFRVCQLLRVWGRTIVAVGPICEATDVCGMEVFAPSREVTEVGEDVVLRVAAYPSSTCYSEAASHEGYR